MIPTPEQIAAFADGQLEANEALLVADAISRSPALQAEVASHKALRARLSAHFAPVLNEPARTAELELLGDRNDNVTLLAEIRARKRRRLAWIAAPALAASVALAVMLRPAVPPAGYAEPGLASMLDDQLVSTQAAGSSQRILLTFSSRDGRFCRAYSTPDVTGIACRDGNGWKIERLHSGARQQSEYRQAASEAEIMAQAQDMASGPALTVDEELNARAHDWLKAR